ncbi:MAG: transposase [Rhodoferax sp.]|nr:transposase [Rhodoferax sp.]
MKRLQAFKFELMPNGEQEQDMCRFAGARRFVYNRALDIQKANHESGGKYIGYVDMANRLPEWKKEKEWLKEPPSQILQQALKDADRAYKNFFEKRAGFPCRKKKGRGDSFRFPQGFEIDQANSRIKLPKLGWVRYHNSRGILGMAKNITVSQSGGKWFASIQTEHSVLQPVPTATSAIGIDVGVVRFATMSDGTHIEPLDSFKKHERRLKKYQRRMCRKVKFSKNWHKARRKVQKIHTRISNARKDFLHKETTKISKNHAMVAIEDLQVRNMSKSSAGTTEAPGKNVAQKSGLNKAILDQGWFEFRRQLEYKLNWNGGILIPVPAHYTSQTCPVCGHVAKENRQTQAKFVCVDCGHEENADVVGAKNILARGYRVAACGEDVRRAKVARPKRAASVKQEPTEVTRREEAHV